MQWLRENWFFILISVLFVFMHMGHGHGGHSRHGGHGGERRRPDTGVDRDPTRDDDARDARAGNPSLHDHGA